jgi:hypothetical protein
VVIGVVLSVLIGVAGWMGFGPGQITRTPQASAPGEVSPHNGNSSAGGSLHANAPSGSAAPTMPSAGMSPAPEVDVSGMWRLSSETVGTDGTLVRQGTGFHFHADPSAVHWEWDCDLDGQPGQIATMTCTGMFAGTSENWSGRGPITAIVRNGSTKLEFHGRVLTGIGTTTMNLAPE